MTPISREARGDDVGNTPLVRLQRIRYVGGAENACRNYDILAKEALTERRLTVGLLPKQTDLPLSALAE